jgi:hypothetical protein
VRELLTQGHDPPECTTAWKRDLGDVAREQGAGVDQNGQEGEKGEVDGKWGNDKVGGGRGDM